MFARFSSAAVLVTCAVTVLLVSSANAWALSGKPSEATQSNRVPPTTSTGTPEHVQDHYWWNIKTGIVSRRPAFYADAAVASIASGYIVVYIQ